MSAALLIQRIIPADAGSTARVSIGARMTADHPRRCGEHGPCRPCAPVSPWIIPADAGSTTAWTGRPRRIWDHPRRCGEHSALCRPSLAMSGSSPQMRGALDSSRACGAHPRIIPADAGSTDRHRWARGQGPDHPRRCGEHEYKDRTNIRLLGSSPQMRGALRRLSKADEAQGIIPADAGSTVHHPRLRSYPRDHPRRCGEHETNAALHAADHGSSPQMRGAPAWQVQGTSPERIIPADAGSTNVPYLSGAASGDHPRRCGEHLGVSAVMVVSQGSSPQMRGAPAWACYSHASYRIIPADAGSTIRCGMPSVPPKDHPRRCGEHDPMKTVFLPTKGSSPQMRGALFHGLIETDLSRIIPADAGSTPTLRLS